MNHQKAFELTSKGRLENCQQILLKTTVLKLTFWPFLSPFLSCKHDSQSLYSFYYITYSSFSRTWCFLEKTCLWHVFLPRYYSRAEKVRSIGMEHQGTKIQLNNVKSHSIVVTTYFTLFFLLFFFTFFFLFFFFFFLTFFFYFTLAVWVQWFRQRMCFGYVENVHQRKCHTLGCSCVHYWRGIATF